LKSVISSVLLLFLVGCGQQGTVQKPTESTAEEDADFLRMIKIIDMAGPPDEIAATAGEVSHAGW